MKLKEGNNKNEWNTTEEKEIKNLKRNCLTSWIVEQTGMLFFFYSKLHFFLIFKWKKMWKCPIMIMYGVLENGFLIPVVPFPIAIKLHLIQLAGVGWVTLKFRLPFPLMNSSPSIPQKWLKPTLESSEEF